MNPSSGLVQLDHLSLAIKLHLNTNRLSPKTIKCRGSLEARAAVSTHLKEGVRKFVAVGGDGTINLLASQLVNTNATLGIIPWGSGNGLARHLGIPLSTKGAIRVLNRDRIAMIDYGLINGTPFFCTSGVGFDAHVANYFNSMIIRGFIGYARSTTVEFFRYKPENYIIRDGVRGIEREAFALTVANASQFGNNAFIAPNADITDGQLDVTIIAPFPTHAAPSIGLKLFTKRIHKSRYVETFRTRELSVERATPGLVHFDGESSTMGQTLKYTCAHMGFNVFVP